MDERSLTEAGNDARAEGRMKVLDAKINKLNTKLAKIKELARDNYLLPKLDVPTIDTGASPSTDGTPALRRRVYLVPLWRGVLFQYLRQMARHVIVMRGHQLITPCAMWHHLHGAIYMAHESCATLVWLLLMGTMWHSWRHFVS